MVRCKHPISSQCVYYDMFSYNSTSTNTLVQVFDALYLATDATGERENEEAKTNSSQTEVVAISIGE